MISVIIIVFSCVKPVDDFKIEEHEPCIVMNGLLYPDSIVKIHLSKSIGILDDEKVIPLPNATVELWDKDGIIETLSYDNDGYYISSNPLPDGYYFILKASLSGFKPVEANVEIPSVIPIISYDTSYITETYEDYYFDENDYDNPQLVTFSKKILELTFSFQDPREQVNYYMLEVINDDWFIDYEGDTFLIKVSSNVEANDPIFEMSYAGKWITTLDEGDEIYGSGVVFSDNLINSKKHTITMDITPSNTYPELFNETTKTYVSLIAINEDYYKLLKCLSLYTDDPFDYIFVERVTVYTNVKNGYGLVGAAAPYTCAFDVEVDTTNYYFK